MALTRERKIYAAILLTAVGGLAADRMFFGLTGGPASASAATAAQQASAEASAQSVAPAIPAADLARARLAASLRELNVPMPSVASLDDAFAPIVEEQVVPDAPAIEPEPPAPPTVRAIVSGPRSTALVDGRSVMVGDQVGPWRVVAIERASAIFECDGVRVERTVR